MNNNLFDMFSSFLGGNNFANSNSNFQQSQNQNPSIQNYPQEAFQNMNNNEQNNPMQNNFMQGNFLSVLLSMMGKNGFDISQLSNIFSNKTISKKDDNSVEERTETKKSSPPIDDDIII